eukprot:TRINITY_DN4465_c0_g3_i2.p1 TRINITY_DN4465_c0_g3~~TRINITY_DN4465_c0_g3_i2.p1  ORF type:complete len:319 (+),score=70.14 TRINITY_DN4465_c0_g3_i2:125-958(+)
MLNAALEAHTRVLRSHAKHIAQSAEKARDDVEVTFARLHRLMGECKAAALASIDQNMKASYRELSLACTGGRPCTVDQTFICQYERVKATLRTGCYTVRGMQITNLGGYCLVQIFVRLDEQSRSRCRQVCRVFQLLVDAARDQLPWWSGDCFIIRGFASHAAKACTYLGSTFVGSEELAGEPTLDIMFRFNESPGFLRVYGRVCNSKQLPLGISMFINAKSSVCVMLVKRPAITLADNYELLGEVKLCILRRAVVRDQLRVRVVVGKVSRATVTVPL